MAVDTTAMVPTGQNETLGLIPGRAMTYIFVNLIFRV